MPGERVAIVGIACRAPGNVDGPEALWELLLKQEVTAGPLPDGRWADYENLDAETAEVLRHTVRQGNFLDDVTGFDARFFHVPPAEAEAMDPQQRLLVEVAWEALEHAGIPPTSLAGSDTGVFIGACTEDYGRRTLEDLSSMGPWSGIGAANCALANRISYLMDLRGPSMTADTACSASLVAIHSALRALNHRECRVAIAGGVNLLLSPGETVSLDVAGALSPDGRCRPFDEKAGGYGRSEGAGVLVLKRLEDAQADGDLIHAVFLGSAVQQDGRTEGIMAPSGRAQESVMRSACEEAQISPKTVTYLEAHGTGTRAGDPEEVAALKAVYGHPESLSTCWVGSLKSNLGHMEGAAGVMGVIKASLCLSHRRLVPTVLEQPNPAIDWHSSSLEISRDEQPWPTDTGVRRAAVSSFGYGGTVAHVVLEEGPSQLPNPSGVDSQLADTPIPVPLSSRSDQGLTELAGKLSTAIKEQSLDLGAVASVLALRRSHLSHRAVAVARSGEELVECLDALAAGEEHPSVTTGRTSSAQPLGPVWVFSGHGSHWEGMGRDLMGSSRAFCKTIEQLSAVYSHELDVDLRATLMDATTDAPWPVDIAQSMIYACQVGLAAWWREIGYQPAAVLGHSVGEVAAAVVAGVLSPEDGGALICRRSKLLREAAGKGAMRLLYLSVSECQETLSAMAGLDLAIHSSTRACVVSGAPTDIEQLDRYCEEHGIVSRPVDSSVAFHGRQMDPLAERLAEQVADLTFGEPSIPIYQTGRPPEDGYRRMDAGYWAGNLRNTVHLSEAVESALADGHRHFLEVSGHPVVSHSIDESSADFVDDPVETFWTMRRGDDFGQTLSAVGRLHCAGFSPDWNQFVTDEHRLPGLPTMPWQHRRFWQAASPGKVAGTHRRSSYNLLGEKVSIVGTTVALWTTTLTHATRPYPGSHSISGVEIAPAAVMVQSILDAQDPTTGLRSLTNLRFDNPLFTRPAQRVQVVRADGTITIASRPVEGEEDQEWKRIASASVQGHEPTSSGDILGRAELVETNPGLVRERLSEVGVPETGFAWRVDGLWVGENHLEAHVADVDSLACLIDAMTSIAPSAFPGPPVLRVLATVLQFDVHRLSSGLADLDETVVVQVINNDEVLEILATTRQGQPLAAMKSVQYAPLGDLPNAIDGEEVTGEVEALTALLQGEPTSEALESRLRDIVTDEIVSRLGLDPGELNASQPLSEQGLDSVMGGLVRAKLEALMGIKLAPTLFWESPTIHEVATQLRQTWELHATVPDEIA